MTIHTITVVLALDNQNPHKPHLQRIRGRFFGPGEMTRQRSLDRHQRRVIELWRRFGDGTYTEVA